MKRTAIDHPKMRRLARLLCVPFPYGAIGVMECLAHFTAKHAIQGDVGRWSDEEIAEAVGWPIDDAARLVEALVDAGFIHRDSVHRLILHDWHDHADDSVRKTLGKRKLRFVSNCYDSGTIPERFRNDSGTVANDSGTVANDSGTVANDSGQPVPVPVPVPVPKPEPKPYIAGKPAVSTSAAADCDAFSAWWAQYPRKAGKKVAHSAYEKAVKDICRETGCTTDEARGKLLAAVVAFSGSDKAKGAFCPHPATWLNQGRYDDDPAAWQEPDQKPRHPPIFDPSTLEDR